LRVSWKRRASGGELDCDREISGHGTAIDSNKCLLLKQTKLSVVLDLQSHQDTAHKANQPSAWVQTGLFLSPSDKTFAIQLLRSDPAGHRYALSTVSGISCCFSICRQRVSHMIAACCFGLTVRTTFSIGGEHIPDAPPSLTT
jgi:hypothetical protein